MARDNPPSFKPPLVLTTICLLFVCVAYLPIKSNALITVDLSRLNFSQIYTSEPLIGVKTEYTPGWVNETDWAWRYVNGVKSYGKQYQPYDYPKYKYRTDKVDIIGPKLPDNLTLKDTNFCDEYSLGLWGYWGESKTNGVSHQVLQPTSDADPVTRPYLEPYALKNHTEVKSTANIWDIVTVGGPNGESHVTKLHGPVYNLRLAVIFHSTVFFMQLLVYAFGNTTKSGRLLKPRPELFSSIAFVSFLMEIVAFALVCVSLKDVNELQESLANLALKRIGLTWEKSSQMRGLLGTTIALGLINIVVTPACAAYVSNHMEVLQAEYQQRNNAAV